MELTARQHRWTYPRPAQVMGILNVTPDSFSDDGHYLDAGRAVERAQEMLSEGAEFIDIGGESTRPGAAPVDEAEELRRVIPVVRALAGRTRAVISVDTRKAGVARAALDAAGYGAITTEILPAPAFYYAEDYHQQYLAKNPGGYCGLGGTGHHEVAGELLQHERAILVTHQLADDLGHLVGHQRLIGAVDEVNAHDERMPHGCVAGADR